MSITFCFLGLSNLLATAPIRAQQIPVFHTLDSHNSRPADIDKTVQQLMD